MVTDHRLKNFDEATSQGVADFLRGKSYCDTGQSGAMQSVQQSCRAVIDFLSVYITAMTCNAFHWDRNCPFPLDDLNPI